MPTVLAELGSPVRKEKQIRGKSLRPADLSERGRVFSQRRDAAALRTTRWKYILRFESGREELYDLGRDPREQQNRAGEYPERVRRWRPLLEAFRERHYRPPSDRQPTEKDRTRLEGLGYM